MTDINRRAPRPPPRSAPEILDEIDRAERRHNGPPGPSSDRWDGASLDELAARRRWERTDREAVLRADLRRFENLRAEHLRWLRISVRQFRAALRLPQSPDRERQLAFARDAIHHNKESVRIWTEKVADARAKLDRARRWASAAE